MRKIMSSINYNKKRGYIIHPVGILAGGSIRISIPPAIEKTIGTDGVELSQNIIDCIEISRKSEPLQPKDRNPDWLKELTGIKTNAQFSKAFDSLSVEDVGNSYRIVDFKYKEGKEYHYDFDKSDLEGLGNKIIELFTGMIPEVDDGIRTFETLEESVVTYSRPSLDYEDIEDGHTDAYQIYIYGSDYDTYIGFMIDPGYEGFTADAVKKQLSKWKDNDGEVSVEEINGEHNYFHAHFDSATTIREAFIYKDHYMVLETIFEIPKNHPELVSIKKEFERVISTVRIA